MHCPVPPGRREGFSRCVWSQRPPCTGVQLWGCLGLYQLLPSFSPTAATEIFDSGDARL